MNTPLLPLLLLPALLPAPRPTALPHDPAAAPPAARPAVASAGSAAAATSPDGWVSLFDGESLAGWTPTGGRYDGNARWTVEDGAIVGRQGEDRAGGLLYTETSWGDFEFEAEVWLDHPFDSGVFARMRPDARGMQFTLDHRPGGEIGGLYADGYVLHNPEGLAAWNDGVWNLVRCRVEGEPMQLTMWVNGARIVRYRVPEGLGTFAREGRIGIQVHPGESSAETARAMFRKLRARPLPEGAGQVFRRDDRGHLHLTAAGEACGWRSLFNGTDLTGWQAAGSGTGYRVRDGVLEFLSAGDSPHLVTEADHRDFQLRFDFQLADMANSGLFLRAARDGSNPAFSGREVQLLDDHNWERVTGSTLKPWQFTGSLYGSVAPRVKDALRPNGEWNTLDVTLQGTRMITVLNGKILYDVDTVDLAPEQGPPFSERATTGFLGLQRHAPAGEVGEVFARFRNLYLRTL